MSRRLAGRHQTMDKHTRREVSWLERQPGVTKITLDRFEVCRHHYPPGHIRLQATTDVGFKLKAYADVGLRSLHVHVAPHLRLNFLTVAGRRWEWEGDMRDRLRPSTTTEVIDLSTPVSRAAALLAAPKGEEAPREGAGHEEPPLAHATTEGESTSAAADTQAEPQRAATKEADVMARTTTAATGQRMRWLLARQVGARLNLTRSSLMKRVHAHLEEGVDFIRVQGRGRHPNVLIAEGAVAKLPGRKIAPKGQGKAKTMNEATASATVNGLAAEIRTLHKAVTKLAAFVQELNRKTAAQG